MGAIQGELAPIMLSSDGGITWKALVCLSTNKVDLSTTTNKVETNCGPLLGVGSISFSPSGTAVLEATPSAGQVTYKDMLNWQVNKTLIMFKVEYPSSGGQYGQNLTISGTCYVTKTTGTFETGKVITFDFTLEGTGLVNILPI